MSKSEEKRLAVQRPELPDHIRREIVNLRQRITALEAETDGLRLEVNLLAKLAKSYEETKT
jgi:hypothetical protein